MTIDAPTSRREVRQHKEPADGPWLPTEPIQGNSPCQPRLDIMPSERLLDRRELGLYLHYDEHATPDVPADQVDRAALSPDRIADLGPYVPAAGSHGLGASTHESGVALIDEAIEVAASPPNRHDQLGIERASDRVKVPERHAVQVASLDTRDHVLADAGSLAQIVLPPPTTVPNGPNQAPDPLRVHDGSIASGARLAIHAASPADHVRTARVVGAIHRPGRAAKGLAAISYAPGA